MCYSKMYDKLLGAAQNWMSMHTFYICFIHLETFVSLFIDLFIFLLLCDGVFVFFFRACEEMLYEIIIVRSFSDCSNSQAIVCDFSRQFLFSTIFCLRDVFVCVRAKRCIMMNSTNKLYSIYRH